MTTLCRIAFMLNFTVSMLASVAQTTIRGTVTDSKGNPLTGANIYLAGAYDGVSSGHDGKFVFTTRERGTRLLKVDFIGFEGFDQEVQLNNDTLRFDIKLREKINQMTAVVITAGAFEAGDQRRSATLSSLDMVTTAGANGDIYGALQMLPGTSANPESGKLFVKGGAGEESQTYIDGTLALAPYTSSPPLTAVFGRFDPFMFKGTIFSTGGYSAEYGQALSSVLQLNTNDMPDEEELHISLLSVGAGVAGTKKWNNGAVRTSVNYTNLKPYMNVVPQQYNWNRPPEYLSTDVSIRQKTGSTGLLKLYANFNNSVMSLNRADLNNERKMVAYDLKNDNLYLNGSWQSALNKNWMVRTGVSFTENLDKTDFGRVSFRETLRGVHQKTLFIHQLNQQVSIRMGVDFFATTFIHALNEDDANQRAYYTGVSGATFGEADVYLSNRFLIRAGGRAEYSHYLQTFAFSPRFSSAYKFDDHTLVSLAYGWFTQDPLNRYLIYSGNLRPESADHYILTMQKSKNRRLFRSELYYKNYTDLVKIHPGEIYLPQTYDNTGEGYAYGFDIFWRDQKSLKNGEYWISYGYLNTERDFRDYPHKAIPTFVSRHNLSVVYKHWIHPIRSLAGISYRFASPRVYHDPNQAGFHNRKTIPFHSLDVNIAYLHRENIIFYMSVSNLPGFRQEYGHRFADMPGEQGIYASEPIVPGAERFFVIACFITLSKRGDINQMDKIQ